jgi:hypothetical protein
LRKDRVNILNNKYYGKNFQKNNEEAVSNKTASSLFCYKLGNYFFTVHP